MIMETELDNIPHLCAHHRLKRISWSAIFVGAIVGVGLGFLLDLFGIAIGLSAFTLTKDGAIVLAIGGMFGITIGIIASMMTAGYAAGYLGRHHCPQRNLGIVYGFTTWSIALILCAVLSSQINAYLTSYSNAISHAVFVTTTDNAHPVPSVSTKATPSKANEQQKTTTITVSPNSLAWSAFSLFIIFFIGAISACIGACWGMSCRRED